MIKAGFLINSLGPTQQSIFLTSCTNELVDQRPDYSMCVFYRNYNRIIVTPHFAMFSEYEVWTFDGTVIATDIHAANSLLRCPGPKKKYFYIWEPEWAFLEDFSYEDMAKVYQSDEMELIVRSQFHYDIVERLWKKPVAIIEEFNHEQLTELLQNNT